MKFLLVRPHVDLKVVRRFHAFLHLEPLDLEIVAGGIPAPHETRILDLTISRRPGEDLAATLREFGPDVIGFSGYSNQARNVKRLAAAARRQLPDVRILVGGIHATIAPLDYRDTPAINLVVRGEGATAMRDLMPALTAGNRAWPESERFLPTASPRFEELARSTPPPWPEYSEQPLPRRSLVDRKRYFCVWGGEKGERVKTLFPQVATLRTSTGCPHRCSFCVVHFLAHGKYLQRDPEDVVREIAALAEDHIYFVDDEMFINAQRTEKIARLLLERGIRKHYISWARSDTICRNVELFRLWKQAGLAVLYVGLESLEEQNLQDYHKGLGADTNRRAVGILRELGIDLHAALMVNSDFTKEDFVKVRRSIDFVTPAEVSFTVFSPPPGTELWEKHRREFVCPDPYAFYDCMHTLLPTRLPLNEFYRYFSLLYLFAFRQNPWRAKRVHPPWRDLLRVFRSGALCGYALRTIYKDYDRKLW